MMKDAFPPLLVLLGDIFKVVCNGILEEKDTRVLLMLALVMQRNI